MVAHAPSRGEIRWFESSISMLYCGDVVQRQHRFRRQVQLLAFSALPLPAIRSSVRAAL